MREQLFSQIPSPVPFSLTTFPILFHQEIRHWKKKKKKLEIDSRKIKPMIPLLLSTPRILGVKKLDNLFLENFLREKDLIWDGGVFPKSTTRSLPNEQAWPALWCHHQFLDASLLNTNSKASNASFLRKPSIWKTKSYKTGIFFFKMELRKEKQYKESKKPFIMNNLREKTNSSHKTMWGHSMYFKSKIRRIIKHC